MKDTATYIHTYTFTYTGTSWLPMNLESFNAGTVTFRVSNAKKAPNSSSRPEKQVHKRESLIISRIILFCIVEIREFTFL